MWVFQEDSLKGTDPVGRYVLPLLLRSPPYTVGVMAGTPTATLDYEVILVIEDSTVEIYLPLNFSDTREN